MIKALLIDPYQRTVQLIEFEPTLEEFYRLIDCRCIAGFTDSSGASFTYDDKYLITGHGANERTGPAPAYCIMTDWDYPMGGKLIATGQPDEEGECTDITQAQAQDICQRLNWVTFR
jgi:hypothetical protein